MGARQRPGETPLTQRPRMRSERWALDDIADRILFKFWVTVTRVCSAVPFLRRHTNAAARQAMRFVNRRLFGDDP